MVMRVTSTEAAYSGLVWRQGADADAGLRCNNLVVIPTSRHVVLYIVITHPAAASYVTAASQNPAAAVRRVEDDKKSEFYTHGDGTSYNFDGGEVVQPAGTLSRASCLSWAMWRRRTRASTRVSSCVQRARSSGACSTGNTRLYYATLFPLARAVGYTFRPGSDLPTHVAGWRRRAGL